MTTWSQRPEKPRAVSLYRSATSCASCGLRDASANAAMRSAFVLFMMRFQVGMKLKNSALSIWKNRSPGRGLICGYICATPRDATSARWARCSRHCSGRRVLWTMERYVTGRPLASDIFVQISSLSSWFMGSPTWMTPVSRLLSVLAMAYSSSRLATFAGSSLPSMPTCRGLRSNDTPSAPASMLSRTAVWTASISSPVASRSCDSSPMTHRRTAECPTNAP